MLKRNFSKQQNEWSHTEGTDINVSKTKVMLFSSHSEKAHIKIKGHFVENVNSFKYLCVVLDPKLNFTMQTDYAVGKAKRASAKVYRLIHGDKGLPVSVGINLFKTLIRPHMEYAIPVWASIAEKDLV